MRFNFSGKFLATNGVRQGLPNDSAQFKLYYWPYIIAFDANFLTDTKMVELDYLCTTSHMFN